MLRLFNTMSREKEPFIPLHEDEVGLYSCGPTVYNHAHIGNLSTYVVVDLFKRYLRYRGYNLLHVMNLTDVDDKTIRAARNEGVPLEVLTKRYTDGFLTDLETLNIGHANKYTAATDHVDDMIALIEKLISKGFAYESEGSVYYKISEFPEYGKLARLDVSGMRDGTREDSDEYAKESVRDFVLWKAWVEDDGDVFWESPWGKGRPGWHVECSAMAMKYLGETFDVHTGAVDLIFPHHQNEIAQSEAATGKPFVKYWMHREFLNVGGSKMAKSTGNIATLTEIGKTAADIRAFRYLVVATHYRTGLNYTEEVLEAAKNTMRRLTNFLERLESVDRSGGSAQVSDAVERTRELFVEHMDDDLNSARAVADMFELVQQTEGWLNQEALSTESAETLYDFFQELNQVLGIFYDVPGRDEPDSLPEELLSLIEQREQARKTRDWGEADRLRDRLLEQGIVVKDTPSGTEWERG